MRPLIKATPSTVDLVIEDARWTGANLAVLAQRALDLALKHAQIDAPVEVAVMACDDARIATLNSTFRGKSNATNVLSWPALDLFPYSPGGAPSTRIPPDPFGLVSLGDIAIAYETVVAEATASAISLDDHSLHLILHACLHLLGYDHQTEADAARMEALEVQALAEVGIASPYDG
ncbi:MAG: rRNA maturation RNase YbeY [Pseudomonadota bacterium]